MATTNPNNFDNFQAGELQSNMAGNVSTNEFNIWMAGELFPAIIILSEIIPTPSTTFNKMFESGFYMP